MDLTQILVLSLVQGVAEFLPISSSAHLILTPQLFGWSDQGLSFDLATHAGTLLAVLIYFRTDIARLLHGCADTARTRHWNAGSRLVAQILAATLPALVIGFLLKDVVETAFRDRPLLIAGTLAGFGLLLGAADLLGRRSLPLLETGWQRALIIGCAQAVALIPGVSRSGITMTAGLALGLTREAAARFSFLLAIPVTALAAGYKLLQLALSGQPADWTALFLGGLFSAIFGLLCIHYLLKWLTRHGMWPFVIYRLLLAAYLYHSFA